MKVEQFVMAYGVEHDRLRAIIPGGFIPIRPVLRINAEIRDSSIGYIEFNAAAENSGKKGWLNIGCWDNIRFERSNETVVFMTDFLEISFTGVGVEGACPAEKDNEGCFFIDESIRLRAPEVITSNKEFCDCSFKWKFASTNAHGVSCGKTLPARPTAVLKAYPKEEFTAKNAANIPCEQVLGAYSVCFNRRVNE